MLGLLSATISILSVLSAWAVVVVRRPPRAALALCVLFWLQAAHHLLYGSSLLAILGLLLPGGLVAGVLLIASKDEPASPPESPGTSRRWRLELLGPACAVIVGLAVATRLGGPAGRPRAPSSSIEGLRAIDPGSPGAVLDSMLGTHGVALVGLGASALLGAIAVVLWTRRGVRRRFERGSP